MTPAITRAGWIRILSITVVGICLLPFAPGPKQFWNLHLAQVHADKLKPMLLADPRFRHVKVTTYTGGGGSLMLSGEIGNDEDKAALMQIVVASHPPVKVFNMTIISAKLHQWDSTNAPPKSPPAETLPLSANWTTHFNDGYIALQITNNGEQAFEVSPTPVTYTSATIPTIGLPVTETPPSHGKNVLTPAGGENLTVAGDVVKDEVFGCFSRPSSTSAYVAAATPSARTVTPTTGRSGPSVWSVGARSSSSHKVPATTRSSRIRSPAPIWIA